VEAVTLSLNRDQFAIVLVRLRTALRQGGWVEGEPLTVNTLAHQLGVSATPIREALARLAGEGLVEERRGRGYYARRIDGTELRDLYRAQEVLAHAALRAAGSCGGSSRGASQASRPDFSADTVAAWESLFEALLRIANNNFLMIEQRRLADRLAPARRIELHVLDETAADFEPLLAAWAQSDWSGVGVALAPLLARRRDAAERLVVRLRIEAANYNLSI
jgi:DNA-binding GntR family transcriptional regulator